MKKSIKFSITFYTFIISAIFLIIGIFTLPHYGINWDTINHLPRGQAYLHYFLTGKKDYTDLPIFSNYWQNPKSLSIDPRTNINTASKRSLYQHESMPFYSLVKKDGDGHPPISDIVSSLFNIIFFQKLKIVNDIDAYRIYGIFLSACLVGLVFWWLSKQYSKFAGFVAVISLALYPLFFSESHFNNEKDIPETVYWFFLFFSVWKGVNTKSWKWLLVAGVFFGLGLGTKFNILFALPVIFAWCLFLFIRNFKLKNDKSKLFNLKVSLSLLAIPLIGGLIFYASWPYLWLDPIDRSLSVINFYKQIGTTNSLDRRFIFLKFNVFPALWIVYTTPLVTLFFSLVGLFFALKGFLKERSGFLALILLVFFIPIARVSVSGASVYGGIRQIMEFIPAMSLLSGLGAFWISELIRQAFKVRSKRIKKIIAVFLIICFLPITFKLISIHPNENVYFNSLIGGLKGAKERDFPYWGNSFGAAYRQGVNWINDHAEPNSKVVFARELLPNIPTIWFRSDLAVHNSFRSGYLRNGEYVISLTYQGTENTSYFDRYLNTMLVPVYEVKVDDVSILKVWKNDDAHLLAMYKKEKLFQDFQVSNKKKQIQIDLGRNLSLSRLEGSFLEENCSALKSAEVMISADGRNWVGLPGKMPKEDWSVPKIGDQPNGNSFIIPFAGDKARSVEIKYSPQDSCFSKINQLRLYYFPDDALI